MNDVSKKLMDQFAVNLNTMLDEQGTDSPAPTEPPAEAAASAPADSGTSTPPAADGAPKVRKIEGPAAEPVDLADMAGPAVLKRAVPAIVALLLLFLVLRRRSS
jgi:hypothetical protein